MPDKKAKELAAYGQIVIQLAQRHGGGAGYPMTGRFISKLLQGLMLLIAPSLMAATVMAAGQSKDNSCQLCNGADHQTSACALQPSPFQSTKQDSFSNKRQRAHSSEPCRNVCYQSPMTCKFTHCCLACGSLAHPVVTCPKYRASLSSQIGQFNKLRLMRTISIKVCVISVGYTVNHAS